MISTVIALLLSNIVMCTTLVPHMEEINDNNSGSDLMKINFYLVTRKNPDKRQELKINDSSVLLKSNFNLNIITKVIIHGWISNNETVLAMDTLKDAYAKTTNFNVIMVDWSELAKNSYKVAKSYSDAVTQKVTEFLKYLISNGVNAAKIHLIGHSIGAHIAGNVGQNLREINKLLDAIIGLDPALPLYKFCPENQRLDPSDARHVEVIHSSTNTWGYRVALGHVDFYPNGGKIQPGCDDKRGLCAHQRSILYYADSITDKESAFTSIYWESYTKIEYDSENRINMSGLLLNYNARGQYYLLTRSFQPYALGHPSNWNPRIKKLVKIKDDL